MKKLSFLLILLIFLGGCFQKKEIFDDYTASIKNFQYKLNVEFSDTKISPLTKKDLKKFKSLDFFPIDSTYRVIAKFELNENPIFFEMPTSTGRRPIYKTYGTATFTLNGKELKLHIYQDQDLIKEPDYKNHLFIPFTDLTNSNGSYGGGRYIDLEIPEDDTMVIDFNRAYNPYCAYNEKYSCPIPPRENDLSVEIKAGVKDYLK
ncbi:MAG: DUF1684 domain-containing protein [Flavobacteriaceae bacterium]|nr:DUF1684 domain-containing protein [Flavobacteriaceae bacterium]